MAARILRLPEVVRRTGLSATSVYRAIRAGTFPVQVKLGKRGVGWREGDVETWIEGREPIDMDEFRGVARHRRNTKGGGAHGSANTEAP